MDIFLLHLCLKLVLDHLDQIGFLCYWVFICLKRWNCGHKNTQITYQNSVTWHLFIVSIQSWSALQSRRHHSSGSEAGGSGGMSGKLSVACGSGGNENMQQQTKWRDMKWLNCWRRWAGGWIMGETGELKNALKIQQLQTSCDYTQTNGMRASGGYGDDTNSSTPRRIVLCWVAQ